MKVPILILNFASGGSIPSQSAGGSFIKYAAAHRVHGPVAIYYETETIQLAMSSMTIEST